MRTLAHALIHRRYIEKGLTTRFITLPLPESGLPQNIVQEGQPVTLDILAGRPVNLELEQQGMSVDLCFDGPPVRCTFPWQAVLATQDASGELVQTTVVTVATVMEDNSLLAQPPTEGGAPESSVEADAAVPRVSVLEGGGKNERSDHSASTGGDKKRARPRLQLVESKDIDEPPN